MEIDTRGKECKNLFDLAMFNLNCSAVVVTNEYKF